MPASPGAPLPGLLRVSPGSHLKGDDGAQLAMKGKIFACGPLVKAGVALRIVEAPGEKRVVGKALPELGV